MCVNSFDSLSKIERNHLTLRTRIKRLCRKTICFSKNLEIHKAVIGTITEFLTVQLFCDITGSGQGSMKYF